MDNESDDNGRDERGRWKKNYCPNPKGRPRKKPEVSDSDVLWFKQNTVQATINGEKRSITRHALLLHAMFEQALQGKVSMARALFQRFEQADETWQRGAEIYRYERQKLLQDLETTGELDIQRAEELLELADLLKFGKSDGKTRKRRRQS